MDGGKQGAPIKKSKKDKAASATAKAVRLEANTVPAAPRVKPELPLPVMYFLESYVILFITSMTFLWYIYTHVCVCVYIYIYTRVYIHII